MDDLQPITDLLTKKWPWLSAALVSMATFRLAVKVFSGHIQAFLTRLLSKVAESQDTDDDALVAKLLTHKGYRFLAFLIDLFLSIKLPTIYSFVALKTVTEMNEAAEKAKASVNPILQPKSK